MLVAAAVCPCPPLLVPEVAAGAAPELDALRDACADAVGVLSASRPDLLVAVGPADVPGRVPFPAGARGSFRPFGVAMDVRLGMAADSGGGANDLRALPPSLAVAAWLLRDWKAGPLEGLGVGEQLAPDRCAAAGRDIAASAGRVALLVMGDGSACRSVKAPGYLDERAEGFDAAVGAALAAADIEALAGLDAELAQQLQAAGRAPWQLLAGAARGTGLGGQLLYEAAPYGVGYVVAAWS
ncbi:class III extradiol dioxygenase subunit B-like domain-containing protein [Streptomyces sp. NBC_01477]|uniref:class III extradiol dioxygenase subunit B-like domain-containing protein n=1 Tax=Streptomyces sp. NBC_01477 TaxID=2976015 RepID=UPI002E35F315|nr:class III extradiol dioxygenase subunit B-like domain-containing protein [Streptomyces sp. NBC_01477]